MGGRQTTRPGSTPGPEEIAHADDQGHDNTAPRQAIRNFAGLKNMSVRLFWRKALSASDLSATVKLVGNVIANHWFADGYGAHPSLETIATEASFTKKTVITAIQKLESEGWLLVSPGGGRRPVKRRRGSFKGLANEYEAWLPDEVWEAGGWRVERYEYGVSDDAYGVSDDEYGVTDASDTGSSVTPQVLDLEVCPERFPSSGRSAPERAAPDGEVEEQPEKSVLDHLDEYFQEPEEQEHTGQAEEQERIEEVTYPAAMIREAVIATAAITCDTPLPGGETFDQFIDERCEKPFYVEKAIASIRETAEKEITSAERNKAHLAAVGVTS